MGIYTPANDICHDAAFLFKDRPELIRWVYGEAWETSSVKLWLLTSFGVWQIDLSLAELLLRYYAIRLDWRSLFEWRHLALQGVIGKIVHIHLAEFCLRIGDHLQVIIVGANAVSDN